MTSSSSFKIIPDFLARSVFSFPNKSGLIFEDLEYSYKEIKERSDSVAAFVARKTQKRDTVALFSGNCPEMIFCYFGILSAGRVVLLVPANTSDKNLLFQIEKIKPKIIIFQSKFEQKLKRTGIAENIFYIDADKIPKESFSAKEKVSPNDISATIFTSGTASEPKAVVLRHRNVVESVKNITGFLKWDASDIDVNILPLSHSFGLGNIHCAFGAGATVILFSDAINIKKIIQTMIEKKATTFAAVPATLRLIVDNYFEEFKKCDKFLRFLQTNTSLMDKELIKKVLSALPNVDFNYYYGLTEASRSTFFSINKHLDKIGSVGRAIAGSKIKIIDEDGKELPAGSIGQICIKGKHVVKEGWLETGDAGYLDKDGYLYFKSRKDDIINISGEKVSPEEIEGVVKKVSGVKDAAAIGIKDRLLGQTVKLFVVADASDFDAKALIQECQRKLESHKVPKLVEVIKEIPRTDSGKVRRSALKI